MTDQAEKLDTCILCQGRAGDDQLLRVESLAG